MALIRRLSKKRADPLSRLRRQVPFEGMAGVPIDLVETGDEFVVSADLPGLDAEDVDVTVVGNRLRIRGAFHAEEERAQGNVYVCERRYGSFQRSIAVPASFNADAVEATYENGVLRVALPKSEPKKRKQIDVKRPFEEI